MAGVEKLATIRFILEIRLSDRVESHTKSARHVPAGILGR